MELLSDMAAHMLVATTAAAGVQPGPSAQLVLVLGTGAWTQTGPLFPGID